MMSKFIVVFLLTIQFSDVRPSKNGTGKAQSNYPENAQQESGKCDCGIAKDKKAEQTGNIEKVIQGDIVKPIYKYPWMVGIFWKGRQTCGAAIIAQNYLLTAAHCFAWPPDKVKSREQAARCTPFLGKNRYYCPVLLDDIELRYNGEQPGLTHVARVEEVILSYEYEQSPSNDDIALLRTVEQLPCNKYTAPICLPTVRGLYKANKKVIVAGWGQTNDTETKGTLPAESVLKEANLIIECRKNCETIDVMSPHSICCKESDGQACKGDSGGPLFKKVDGRYYLVGITSYGVGDYCSTSRPSFYTKVKPYLPWIEKKTGLTFNFKK